MVKIAIDAGHGRYKSLIPKIYTTPGKRTPDGQPEWEFNNKVVLAAIKYLKEYKNVQILRLDDPTGKTDVPLADRTKKAFNWGADAIVSSHHNANEGIWFNGGGTETFTYLGSNLKAEKLARMIHTRTLKAYGLKDRGLKKADFHMTREPNKKGIPGVLVEGGFMDSTTDIKKLRDDKVLDAAGKAIAEGLAEYFGLVKEVKQPTKPSQPSNPTPNKDEKYKVVKTIPGYVNAADAKSGKNKKTDVKAGEYFIFSVSNGMINVTTKNGVPGSWINPSSNVNSKPVESKPSNNKEFKIKVKVDNLWYYSKPDWNAKKDTVNKNDVFTVVETLTVNGSKMYKLKSGTYITANTKYVEKI